MTWHQKKKSNRLLAHFEVYRDPHRSLQIQPQMPSFCRLHACYSSIRIGAPEKDLTSSSKYFGFHKSHEGKLGNKAIAEYSNPAFHGVVFNPASKHRTIPQAEKCVPRKWTFIPDRFVRNIACDVVLIKPFDSLCEVPFLSFCGGLLSPRI